MYVRSYKVMLLNGFMSCKVISFNFHPLINTDDIMMHKVKPENKLVCRSCNNDYGRK